MTTPSLANIVKRTRELVDEKQAAEHLTVSPGTLSVWRSTGRYNLPFVKIGRMVRYRISDLDAWIAGRSRDTGATV
jgi:predicted DNA-binding transcriptional regulator AlpA